MLRKTDDIYKVSAEIKKLGAFALLALCKSAGFTFNLCAYLLRLKTFGELLEEKRPAQCRCDIIVGHRAIKNLGW